MRGFDPQAVNADHIKRITFLYGKDSPGMALRMERFEEIIEDQGFDLHKYSSLDADALGYIQSGDLFSDDLYISVRDISSVLGSSSDSQHKLKALTKAISTYGPDSRFLFSAETTGMPKALSAFIDFVKSQGGVAREVKAPSSREMATWVKEYLVSTGRTFPNTAIEIVCSVADGDVNIARTILDNIGEEVASLSYDDITEWLDIDRNTPLSQIYESICTRDMDGLVSYRRSFNTNQAGLRLFLLKLRYVTFDLMLLTECDDNNLQPFFDFKSSQYGRSGVNARQIRDLALRNGDPHRYRAMYFAINDAIARISGASSKEFSYASLYADIVA